MSHDITKPTKWVCHQRRLRSPGHPPSLIRVFTVRMKKAWVLRYPLSTQRRLWSDWADAQADLSLRWEHTHFVGFVMLRLIYWQTVIQQIVIQMHDKLLSNIVTFITAFLLPRVVAPTECTAMKTTQCLRRCQSLSLHGQLLSKILSCSWELLASWYLWLSSYGELHKNLKNLDTRKFAVNILKFEQCGFTIE